MKKRWPTINHFYRTISMAFHPESWSSVLCRVRLECISKQNNGLRSGDDAGKSLPVFDASSVATDNGSHVNCSKPFLLNFCDSTFCTIAVAFVLPQLIFVASLESVYSLELSFIPKSCET
jgi:hypothetical protein